MADKEPALTEMQKQFIKASTEREAYITYGNKEVTFTIRRWTLSETLVLSPLHAKIMQRVISALPELISPQERERLESAVDSGSEEEVNVSLEQMISEGYNWEVAFAPIAEDIMTFMAKSLKHNKPFNGDELACRKYVDEFGDMADVLEVLLKASVLNKIDDAAKKKYVDLAGLYRIQESPQS